MNVPELTKKLATLYRRHSLVNNDTQLGAYLGVKSHNISTWKYGTDVNPGGNYIPDKHVARISELYQIQSSWLGNTTSKEFQELLDRHPYVVDTGHSGPWRTLATEAIPSETIALIRHNPPPVPLIRIRGATLHKVEKIQPEPFWIDEHISLVPLRSRGSAICRRFMPLCSGKTP